MQKSLSPSHILIYSSTMSVLMIVQNGDYVILSHLIALSVVSLYMFEESYTLLDHHFMLSKMVIIPTPHIKVSMIA